MDRPQSSLSPNQMAILPSLFPQSAWLDMLLAAPFHPQKCARNHGCCIAFDGSLQVIPEGKNHSFFLFLPRTSCTEWSILSINPLLDHQSRLCEHEMNSFASLPVKALDPGALFPGRSHFPGKEGVFTVSFPLMLSCALDILCMRHCMLFVQPEGSSKFDLKSPH